MLENPTDLSSTTNNATIKRYVHPNQRNCSLGGRKYGGDRLERTSSYGSDGDKKQAATLKDVPIMDNADLPQLIGLQGCGRSEAYQLLNNRWTAAIDAYENPSTYFAERPIMYSGCSSSAWGQIRLPHQMVFPMAVVGQSGPEMDFISELRQIMHDTNTQF
ncbi:hypothetical protein QVD17_02777 [Tagetes erecta]|uniref:Uncharacterized protein n=1 Tax=Tagetes erecta TaxID=13708 RepID=A0AAD8L9T4_TARER|nr:hypothetical protein QVD17_02777 [Tagetes erecta]